MWHTLVDRDGTNLVTPGSPLVLDGEKASLGKTWYSLKLGEHQTEAARRVAPLESLESAWPRRFVPATRRMYQTAASAYSTLPQRPQEDAVFQTVPLPHRAARVGEIASRYVDLDGGDCAADTDLFDMWRLSQRSAGLPSTAISKQRQRVGGFAAIAIPDWPPRSQRRGQRTDFVNECP